MDLPTYTNIWRIEKRLYKLYDLRLPMPLPLVQIGVFLGVFVPWILLLRIVGIPFESPWHVLYIVPPGVLTWMATRPVIEGKRLTELLLSQGRYLAEPRTWCRLTPIREPREVVIVARVWRRTEAPAPVAAMERAAIKSRRRRRHADPEPTPIPARLPRPATAAAPPPLVEYAAQREPEPVPAAAPPKPWRRTTRDISHEDDVLPVPAAEMERPPATPQLETPPGSGKRALASGVRRPGAPAEFWQAAQPTRPDIPQQTPADIRRTAEEIANGPRPAPATTERTPAGGPAGTTPPDAHTAAGRPVAPQRQSPPPAAEPPQPPPVRAEPPHDSEQVRAQEPGSPTTGAESSSASEVAQPPRVPSDARAAGPAAAAAPQQPESSEQTRPQWPGVPAAERARTPEPSGAREPSQTQPVRAEGDPSDLRVAGRAAGGSSPEGGASGASQESEQVRAQESGSPAAGAEPAPAGEVAQPPRVPAEDVPSDVRVAGRAAAAPSPGSESERVRAQWPGVPGAEGARASESAAAGEATRTQPVRAEGGASGAPGPAGGGAPGEAWPTGVGQGGAPAPEAAPSEGGEPGDRRVAGVRTPPPPPWAPPPVTRPDVPMVPGAFGAQGVQPPAQGGQPPAPRREPPKPWSEELSRPQWPAAERPAPPQPALPQPAPPQPASAQPAASQPVPAPAPPVEEQAPPREVRSQPASPVRPRPLPPPPAPPPSGPAITPPGPEHEVTTGGLRRLIHAVGGGHGEVDAEYQQRLQQPFHGTRHVVVLGCTGGAGQTVTALMLGHTFAQHNGEPVVAIDVNPGPGALARRTRSDTNETLTGLITRADQVGSLTAMRRYTSQAKSGLDVIAAGKNPLQALDDRDYALAIRTIDRFYSVTLLDAAAAVVARVLPYADQIVLVAPASADAPRAVAMTFEWLDGHGYEELRSRAVTVINGVSRRSMDDVEQAEAVARGRCRALVRIPWDDHLSMDRAPRNELKSLRTPTRRAYLALAGVVAGGFTVMPERYQELQQEQEATR
ncbi:TcpE family conjugal transfer membrane protein [Actinomadura monticuli]|uniref:TcpE family conjugal transfer membrane protein n=2 Tax=Actinomadura TaxID=1988 RepID=A0ABV4QDN7_9ACTN